MAARKKAGAIPESGSPPLGAYGMNKPLASVFIVILAGILGFGSWRMLTDGLRNSEAMLAMGLLMGAACYLGWWVLRDLRFKGPILTLERDGLRDIRRGGDIIPWTDIEDAVAKRRGVMSGNGIRLLLTSGERVDIEMYLLSGSPGEALEIIHEKIRRGPGKRKSQ